MSKKRVLREYDPEFRAQAVKLALSDQKSVAIVAKDLGIPIGTLHTWLYKAKSEAGACPQSLAEAASEAPSKPQQLKLNLPSPSQRQHERLRELEQKKKELEVKLRRMTMERDVLKKAMAYCLDVPK